MTLSISLHFLRKLKYNNPMTSSTTTFASVTYLDITLEQADQRIDNFLFTQLKGVPKSHIYQILRRGEVRVNKGRIKPTYRLQAGDRIRLPPVQQQEQTTPKPTAHLLKILANTILYEDNALLVINKPAGMAVHGGSGISFGVIEGLRALYPKTASLELVHRLDRETSGCLLIAKKRSMLKQLHEAFRCGKIAKSYLALAKGQWQADLTEVDAPLEKNHLQSGERVVRVNQLGKPAQSQFSSEKIFPIATLLRVHPLTGRTHQIRVHATHHGHPLAGDEKYGDPQFNQQMRTFKLNRLFLHAEQIKIHLPEPAYRVTVNAPLPTDLQQVLHQLETL